MNLGSEFLLVEHGRCRAQRTTLGLDNSQPELCLGWLLISSWRTTFSFESLGIHQDFTGTYRSLGADVNRFGRAT